MSEDGMSVNYHIEQQASDSGPSSDESYTTETHADADTDPAANRSYTPQEQEESWDW